MKRLGILSVALAMLWAASQAAAQDTGEGRQLYDQSCASCHQPGGTGLEGSFPPLAGNPRATDTVYVADVIRNGLSGPLEVDGVSYDEQMPAVVQLDDAQVAAVAAYVATLAGAVPPTPTTPEAAPAAGGDAAAGRALFLGGTGLANGGPACMACHAAGSESALGGSNLGPDLTGLFDRFGGETGLRTALASPPSPTMTPLFSDHPLTDSEIADLVAYFDDVRSESPGRGVDFFLLAGLGGLAILIAFMAVAIRRPGRSYPEQLRSAR